jgi:hypothetical protein
LYGLIIYLDTLANTVIFFVLVLGALNGTQATNYPASLLCYTLVLIL